MSVTPSDTFVVVAPGALMEQFKANCERAGFSIRVMSVQEGSFLARGLDRAEDAGMGPLLLRLDRAAAALDVSESAVKRLVRSGELQVVKVGGSTRVPVAALTAYVDRLAGVEPTDRDVNARARAAPVLNGKAANSGEAC